MRRSRLPKAQPKILDGGRRSSPKSTPPTPIPETSEKNTGKQIPAEEIPKCTESDVVQAVLPTVTSQVKVQEANATPCDVVDVPMQIIFEPETTIPEVVSTPKDAATNDTQSQEKPKAKRQYRKRHQPPPEPDKMRLMDYIFFNPTSDPISKPVDRRVGEQDEPPLAPTEEEETVDNPDIVDPDRNTVEEGENEGAEILPGPRVMVGLDGQITIDETSLVIQRTKPDEDISKKDIVYETSDTTYNSFRKKTITRKVWTDKETAKFYKVLSIVGTDFTLMENMFPEKTRPDLKNKYKKEERVNGHLVNKALSEWQQFDMEDLEEYLKDNSEPVVSKAKENARGRSRAGRGQGSKGGPTPANRDAASGKKKPTKPRVSKKSHHNPIWDESNDEEMAEEFEEEPCEQCAIAKRMTKRQQAMAEKGNVRTCQCHNQQIGSGDSDNETLPLDSDRESVTSKASKASQRPQKKRKTNSVELTPMSETSTVPNRSADELEEIESPQSRTPSLFGNKASSGSNRSPTIFATPTNTASVLLNPKVLSPAAIQTVRSSDSLTSTNLGSSNVSVIRLPLATPSTGTSTTGSTPLARPSNVSVIQLPLATSSSRTSNPGIVRTSSAGSSNVKVIQLPPAANTGSSTTVSTVGRTPQPGQIVVVASTAPNSDQQVLHLYLVSPPAAQVPTTATPSSPLKTLLSLPSRCTLSSASTSSHNHIPNASTRDGGGVAQSGEESRTEITVQSRGELSEAIKASEIPLFGSKADSENKT